MGRGFTDRWLGAMSASPNPVLARWQWRLGHRRCSLTDVGEKYAGSQSDLEALRQPLSWLTGPSPISHEGEVLTFANAKLKTRPQ